MSLFDTIKTMIRGFVHDAKEPGRTAQGRGLILLMSVLALVAMQACSVFAEHPPCQADTNCRSGEVCDMDSHSCVPQVNHDAAVADTGFSDAIGTDAAGTDAAGTDAASTDAAGTDAASTDAASTDVTSTDAASTDAASTDAASTDVALADAAVDDSALNDAAINDAAPPIEICDDIDNNSNGSIDEGCDDDADGYCDMNMQVVGNPAICPNSAANTADDCDDTVPTCQADCVSNSDSVTETVPVVDCLELFCGSDPADAASVCTIVTTGAELNAAITASAQNDGEGNHILVETFTVSSALDTINNSSVLTLAQRPTDAIYVSGGNINNVLTIAGDDVSLKGLTFVNLSGARTFVNVTSANVSISDCSFLMYDNSAIHLNGSSQSRIFNNIISGGRANSANNKAGIVLSSATSSQIVGNLLVQNNHDALQITDSSDVVMDHNTLADNAGDALEIFGNPSTITSGLCMRSNIMNNNVGVAIRFTASDIAWETGASCTDALAQVSNKPAYGNQAFANHDLCAGNCSGGVEADCLACLPAGLDVFWEFTATPDFVSTSLNNLAAFCPQSAEMTDSGDDLGWDRNGVQPALFNASGPEIGARERGSAACGWQ